MDPLARLGRKDKWFLGGGSGAIFAPPFPRFLTAPGFCDECYLADIRIPRLFTAHFMDRHDRPLRLTSYVKGWRPDRLTIMHYGGDVVIREQRCVTSGNAWVAEFELVTAVMPITVVMYTVLPHSEAVAGTPWQSLSQVSTSESAISATWQTAWPMQVSEDRTGIDSERLHSSSGMNQPIDVHLAFGASQARQSFVIELAQAHEELPLWEVTVLPECLRSGRLPNTDRLGLASRQIDGLVHIAQQYLLDDRTPLTLACGSGLSQSAALSSLKDAATGEALASSAKDWRLAFASVPQFESSDPLLTNAYWNRWYGLRLNTVNIPGLSLASPTGPSQFSPFVTEGVGFFRNFVTYSAQAHLREMAWAHDPAIATGIVANLAKIQRPDHSLPGHSYSNRPSRDFYHADFATGISQLCAIHGTSFDLTWLARYADYLRSRSADGWVQIYDQNETGQEYMSRYTEVLETADEWDRFSVGGTDATTYFGLLCKLLGDTDGVTSACRALDEGYDSNARFYCDRKTDGSLSTARPATGFYPYLLLDQADTSAIDRWLLNPEEFWLGAGFPATAASDPTFDAHARWKGRRMNCPWNGRAWPMVNSHIVDILAKVARSSRPDLRSRAGEALMKFMRMMSVDGNPHRPSSYEHYNPTDGTPSLYRGFDDYMHSWIVDLIIRHAVGYCPHTGRADPLRLEVDWIRCENIPRPGGFAHVEVRNGDAEVSLDGSG